MARTESILNDQEIALVAALDALATSGASQAIRKSGATTLANVDIVSGSFADDETPTGAVNGTNPTFTIANTPTSGTLKVYEGGVRKLQTIDWSLSGTTITFTYNPPNGSYVRVDYRY